jgi:hypothetical protein
MKNRHLVITLLLAAYHTGWAMKTTITPTGLYQSEKTASALALTTPTGLGLKTPTDFYLAEKSATPLLLKNAAPSGLTLAEDDARINHLFFDQLPREIKNTHLFSDLESLNTKITQAQVALAQYHHNPALDPELAQKSTTLASKRFIAAILLADLEHKAAKAKRLLVMQRRIKGQIIVAVGSVLAIYLANSYL